MTEKSAVYKVTMTGAVSVKDQVVSQEVARAILNLLLGGNVDSQESDGGSSGMPGGVARKAPNDSSLTSKQFMSQKRPSSEIERITCLAYFLSHNKGIPAFKTRDLTKLNTDAAQPSFSNATIFARNAVQAEYLSLAGGGQKQISALGEAVVEALPDRDKVKAAIEAHKTNRKRRGKRGKKSA